MVTTANQVTAQYSNVP